MDKINIKTSIQKGWDFLEKQNIDGFYKCYIGQSCCFNEEQQSPPETSNILITEVLLKYHPNKQISKEAFSKLLSLAEYDLLTYFEDKNLYPPDSDVNALAYSILFDLNLIKRDKVEYILSIILKSTNENGISLVWITDDQNKKYTDHVVSTNIIYLAMLLNQDEKVEKDNEWIKSIFWSNQYKQGSRYYNSPYAFLFAINRLVNRFPRFDESIKKELANIISKQKKDESTIDLAIRIIIAKSFRLETNILEQTLLDQQEADGSWPANALFKFGSKNMYFGSKALTTAYSIRALEI